MNKILITNRGEIALRVMRSAKEMNINDPNFEEQVAALDKDKTYLVYCRSGNRSAKACSKMEKEGLENLYNLSGGFKAWSSK